MISENDQKTPPPSPLFARVEQLLGIDLRALGIFRVLIGLLILIDLSVRVRSLVAHYTDAGIVPREALYAFGEVPMYLLAKAGVKITKMSGDFFLTSINLALL